MTAGAAALTQLSPDNGRQAESLTVAITGSNTNFANGSTSAFFGGDVAVTSLVINSPTSATAGISISQFASPGVRNVTLTTAGESATIANGFTVTPGESRVTSVSPATGRQADTLDVAVSAQFTNFVNGTTTADFGAGITVNSVTVIERDTGDREHHDHLERGARLPIGS